MEKLQHDLFTDPDLETGAKRFSGTDDTLQVGPCIASALLGGTICLTNGGTDRFIDSGF